MTAPISDEIRALIVADYEAGMSQKETADKHGVGYATVHRIAKSAGVNRGRQFNTPADLDAAVEDYVSTGDPIRAVAERHPVGQDSLAAELRKRGLTRRSGARSEPNPARAQVIAEFVAGDRIATIAMRHSIAKSTVAKWLADEGVTVADRHGESPTKYRGGWVQVGLIQVPARPIRQRGERVGVARGSMPIQRENRGSTKDGPRPAASTAGSSRGLARRYEGAPN